MQLEIKLAARSDLQEIAAYIARDNPDRAESFVEAMLTKITTISERPLASRRPERAFLDTPVGPDVRSKAF